MVYFVMSPYRALPLGCGSGICVFLQIFIHPQRGSSTYELLAEDRLPVVSLFLLLKETWETPGCSPSVAELSSSLGQLVDGLRDTRVCPSGRHLLPRQAAGVRFFLPIDLGAGGWCESRADHPFSFLKESFSLFGYTLQK